MHKRTYRRAGMALLIALLWQLGLGAKPALAHLTLVCVEVTPGAQQRAAPGEFRLWFNEPIVARFSSVYVVDAQNQPIAATATQPDPAVFDALRVTLPTLPPGDYMLFWKALAATDGHISQGFTGFRVAANASVQTQSVTAGAVAFSWMEGVLRWMNFVSLAGMIGALALVYLVLTPVHRQATTAAAIAQNALRRRLLRWSALCAGGAFLIGLGMLAWQSGNLQMSGEQPSAWFAQTWLLLTQTYWGMLWLARQGLLLIFGGGLWWLTGRRRMAAGWPLLMIAGRAFDLLLVQALSSHTVSNSANGLLALGNAMLHLLAAGAWMGGLLAVALILLPPMRQRPRVEGWQPIRWRAFTQLAIGSVGVLVVTGIIHIGQQATSLETLLTTLYGQLLLSKLGFVLLAGLCGLGNAFLVHPRLAAPVAQWLHRPAGWTPVPRRNLLHLIGVEVVLGILIFAITGFLTAMPPPSSGAAAMSPIQLLFGLPTKDLLFYLFTPTLETLLSLLILIGGSALYFSNR